MSATQREALEDLRNRVFVSAATAWELGIKQAKGKLLLAEPVSAMLVRFSFEELPITSLHAQLAARLPTIHGDPFDRMLVAQALQENLTLMTSDRLLSSYGVTTI